jgi:hypothetical protein
MCPSFCVGPSRLTPLTHCVRGGELSPASTSACLYRIILGDRLVSEAETAALHFPLELAYFASPGSTLLHGVQEEIFRGRCVAARITSRIPC